ATNRKTSDLARAETSAATNQIPPRTFVAQAKPHTMPASAARGRGASHSSAITRQARLSTGSRYGPRSTITTSGYGAYSAAAPNPPSAPAARIAIRPTSQMLIAPTSVATMRAAANPLAPNIDVSPRKYAMPGGWTKTKSRQGSTPLNSSADAEK